MTKKYEISEQTMNIIFNTLQAYGNRCTYEGERIGGVLAGCPRGPVPTPDELVRPAITAMRHLEKEIR